MLMPISILFYKLHLDWGNYKPTGFQWDPEAVLNIVQRECWLPRHDPGVDLSFYTWVIWCSEDLTGGQGILLCRGVSVWQPLSQPRPNMTCDDWEVWIQWARRTFWWVHITVYHYQLPTMQLEGRELAIKSVPGYDKDIYLKILAMKS